MVRTPESQLVIINGGQSRGVPNAPLPLCLGHGNSVTMPGKRDSLIVTLVAIFAMAMAQLAVSAHAAAHGGVPHDHEGVPCATVSASENDECLAPPPICALEMPTPAPAPIGVPVLRERAEPDPVLLPGAPPTGPPTIHL